MYQAFKRQYQSVILRDIAQNRYARSLSLLKWLFVSLFVALGATYALYFHRILFHDLPQFLAMRNKIIALNHPGLSYMLYQFEKLFLLSIFLLLSALMVGAFFFAFDMHQRNQLIRQAQNNPPKAPENQA